MTTRLAAPLAIGPAAALQLGFAAITLLDAAITAVLLPRPAGGIAIRLLQLAFSGGQSLALGFSLALLVALGHRLLPPGRAIRAGAAFVLAALVGWFALGDDLSIFATPVRIALTAGVALAFPAIVGAAAITRRVWLLRVGWAVLAVAAAVANHLILPSNYPGSHLALTALAGIAMGMVLLGTALPALLQARPARIVSVVAAALASLGAAASVVIWPSSVVLVELARQQSASVLPFLAALRASTGGGTLASVPPEQREWFQSREAARPVLPTDPPIMSGKPIVLLLTVDALRADLLTREDAKGETENLRRLASEGTSFLRARSPASSTSPALGALFAGRTYSSLYWTDAPMDGKLKPFLADEKTRRWPELLTREGVQTTNLVTTDGLWGKLGVVHGFAKETEGSTNAQKNVADLITWLDGIGPGSAFVFSHFLDPHAPYARGEKSASSFERYLAEVEFVDEALGALARAIEERGLWDRTILVISADHGEAFGEHGTNFHGSTIYEELVHVPLIVKGAGVARREVEDAVTLMDLGPTVLDLFRVETPGTFQGQSLVPYLQGRDPRLTRPIAIDSGRRMQALIFPDRIKVIRNLRQSSTELYDLAADPGETRNLVEERPDAAERLAVLAAFFDAHELKKPGYRTPYRQ